MHLLTLPFAGGNRYSLGFLEEMLPDSVELSSLELPGRGMRMYEPLLSSIPQLVNDVFAQILKLEINKYVLFGDCIGALLSFLVTRKLIKENKTLPFRLVLSGCSAPALFTERRTLIMQETEMKDRLLQFGTAPELLNHKGFYEMIEPIMRSDWTAFNDYAYDEGLPLSLPVTVITDQNQNDNDSEVTLWQQESLFPLEILKLDGPLKISASRLRRFFSEVFEVSPANPILQ